MKKVTVVGLGYVGLPLALLADRKGFRVTGLDSNTEKISVLKNKQSPITDEALTEQLKKHAITFTSNAEDAKDSDIIIICVPTPVDSLKMPDLTPLKGAVTVISPHIKPGSLVIIESTVNPGVCDEVVIPTLTEESGLKVGENLFVAHCPERINPGDTKWNVENISRVVGADSEKALEQAVEFYKTIVTAEVKPMGTIKEAEAVKIVENSFRDINIAFVNELAKSFSKMGINLENVIDGAATKPFAFMPHRPGAGVGGHCIPVDPYYLIEHAKGFGFEHRLLQTAREINESMPEFAVSLMEEKAQQNNIDLKDLRVVVLGQAYKPNVDDIRESPAINIYNRLVSLGYDTKRFEPFSTKHSDFANLQDALNFANCVVIGTGHNQFKEILPSELSKAGVQLVVDGRNIFRNLLDQFKDEGIIYVGIGVN